MYQARNWKYSNSCPQKPYETLFTELLIRVIVGRWIWYARTNLGQNNVNLSYKLEVGPKKCVGIVLQIVTISITASVFHTNFERILLIEILKMSRCFLAKLLLITRQPHTRLYEKLAKFIFHVRMSPILITLLLNEPEKKPTEMYNEKTNTASID